MLAESLLGKLSKKRERISIAIECQLVILSRYSLIKYRTSWRRLLTVYIDISQVFMSEHTKYNLRVDPIYLFFCRRFFLFLSPTNILLKIYY